MMSRLLSYSNLRRYSLAPVLGWAILGTAMSAAPIVARDGPTGEIGEVPRDRPKNVDFDQRLNAQIPLELPFRGEDGKPTTLGACVNGKPTILVLAYFRCPMLCNEVLNGVLEATKLIKDYSVGKDYNVVVVSFDPKEYSDIAAPKRAAYAREYGRPGSESGWRFLTILDPRDLGPINTLTDTVGFKYEFDKAFKEYNHASGIMIVTPDGRLSRYFFGIDYTDRLPDGSFKEPRSAQTLRLTLVEAGEGKIGTMADKLLLLCYRFEHLKNGYSLNYLRAVQVGGLLTVLGLAGSIVYLVRRSRRDHVGTLTMTATTPTSDRSSGVEK